MKQSNNVVLLYIFVIILSIFVTSTYCALSGNTIKALKQVEDDLNIVWLNRDAASNPQCGSYTDAGSLVVCNANNTVVTELIAYASSTFGEMRNETFGYLTSLQKLMVVGASWNFTAVPSLTTHDKLKTLLLISNDPVGSYANFGLVDSTFEMNQLNTIYINNAYGRLPTFTSLVKFQNITITQKSGAILSVPLIQANFFNTSLHHFEFRVNQAIETAFTTNILTSAPNLVHLVLQVPSLSINFANFYTLPSSLEVLGLINLSLTSTTMPTFASTSWTGLTSLTLNNLGLTGAFNPQFMYSQKLVYLNIANNPLLTYSLSTEFGEKSSLEVLYSQNTGLSGTVPSNILDRGLGIFNVKQTSLSGALPSAFLCCSKDALYESNIPPSYVFNNNTFTNYINPDSPRSCTPIINSLSPSPFTAASTYITIAGKDLGDSFQISLRNTIGQIATMGCSILSLDVLECTNPYIQGKGDLTFKLIVSSLPTFKMPFSYQNPVVNSVSQAPTLGGVVTIAGQDLYRSSSQLQGSSVKIYGIECTDITVIEPFTKFSCVYVPGITSNTPVVVNVKGLEGTSSQNFFYKAPLVTSANAIAPNTETTLTISGSDFWNEINQTTVLINNSINCPVTMVDHSIIHCLFPATAYTPDSLNLQVTVAGRSSQANKLFQFIDISFCPKSCSGNGKCDVGIGFCVCQDVFGPSCSEGNHQIVQIPNSGLTTPTLSLQSPMNTTVKLDAFLYSVVENDAETIISNWNQTYDDANQSWYFEWLLSNKKVHVTIRYNGEAGQDILSGSALTYPASSYTYMVQYYTAIPVASLSFKLGFKTDAECPTKPTFAYPSGQSSNARWMVWIQDVVKYHARFPIVSLLNGEYTQIQSNPIQATEDSKSQMINVQFPTDLVYSAAFQYDFEILKASDDEVQVLSQTCDAPDSIINTNSDSKKAAIIGGVIGSIGGAIIIAGAVFIIKQQMKMKKTSSLLDAKLKSLSLSD